MKKPQKTVSNIQLKKKLAHYEKLTGLALQKISIIKKISPKERKIAKDFLEMAENYYSDAIFFREKEKPLTALAAFSYAHAWLDAGVRAGILNGKKDNKLFVLP